jgi:hypothetical protein
MNLTLIVFHSSLTVATGKNIGQTNNICNGKLLDISGAIKGRTLLVSDRVQRSSNIFSDNPEIDVFI